MVSTNQATEKSEAKEEHQFNFDELIGQELDFIEDQVILPLI